MKEQAVKPICFYLPQFHTIPENDRWWGEGFTEWSLVREAKPLFEGHQHPVEPEEMLGYYDASDYETRRQQAELARHYGIYGFCYYHYWFGGKRLLEKPLEKMLEDGQPDLPFCLCWANEPWSRRWSGEEQEVLQAQVYGEQADWDAHFEALYRFFQHPNYICVEGKPVFLIYRIGHIPDAEAMIGHWRQLAVERGLPGLHIVAIEGGFPDSAVAPAFVDGAAEHQPSCVLAESQPLVVKGLHVYAAEEIWRRALARQPNHAVHYPGVCHAWDNTPRRGRDGSVVLPSRVPRFRRYLDQVFARARSADHEPFVFVNAWNEWSEGAHLEPEKRNGNSWLSCFRDALAGACAAIAPTAYVNEQAPMTPLLERFTRRPRIEPDAELINAVILHQVKASQALEFGCATGLTGRHLSAFIGADHYIGLEPSAEWGSMARGRLDAVYQVDPDAPELLTLGRASQDFILVNDLLARVAEPVSVLSRLRALLSPHGTACICFENAGSYENIQAFVSGLPTGEEPAVVSSLVRKFTVEQASALLKKAGFRVDKVYRVFSPRLAGLSGVKAQGNSARFGHIRLENLDRSQFEDLFCLRYFVFAGAELSEADQEEDRDEAVSKAVEIGAGAVINYSRYQDRVDKTISPEDHIYHVYAQANASQEYFFGAFQQLQELDTLLNRHCQTRLDSLVSVGDYACHYGRLLRAMRAVLPDAELAAYDIDPGATEFCAQQFGCRPVAVDWNMELAADLPRHQLLTCASLLTHTGIEFYRQVLALWEHLLEPGGLLCFTYLGESYIPRWLSGELDHYGPVDLLVRESSAEEFARQGHTMAGFDTYYSDQQAYGVGFMNEATMTAELAAYPQLEYLGTVPGDASHFNQDLAVVRKRPG